MLSVKLSRYNILLLLIIVIVFFPGCGGVTPNIEDTNQSEIDLIKVTDPESNIFVIASEDSGDTVAGLVKKNNVGNPIKITGAIYIVEQGNAFVIEPGINGLPLRITDSLGNIIKYENYTNSTVDISIYDFDGKILQAPNTIYVDPEELLELKQLYNSINSKEKYDQDAALTILKWVGIGVNWVGCGISIYATVQTAGLLSAAIVKACGSAIASTVIALTQNEIDDAVATGVGISSCVGGGQIDSCVSLVLDIGEMVVEQVGGEEDFINIISVTPDSGLIDGVDTDFTVVVEYNLASSDEGELSIGFNDLYNGEGNPDNHWMFCDARYYINKGSGMHEFNVIRKPKDWGSEGDFNVWACIDEIPEIDNWLLDCDEKILTFY